MVIMKTLGMAFLWGLGGYVAGVPLGIFLINAFSRNTHDKAMEAGMTGAFFVGPIVALIAALAGGIWYAQRQ